MNTSVALDNCSSVLDVEVAKETIRVWLRDGRTITVPLAWYPRLCDGTPAERNNWESVGDGIAVHWPDLHEDIGIADLLSIPGNGSIEVDEYPRALDVEVAEETIRVWLRDGRTVTVPLAWYPRLCDGTPAERNNWESVGEGIAVHWPDLHEDIGIADLLSIPGNGSIEVDEYPRALDVEVAEETIRVWLRDGRTVTVPLAWYPRLCDGTPAERNNWESVGEGIAVHWPDLDEDVSIGGLMSGPSLERATTLGRWLLARREGRGIKGYEIAEHERTRRAVPLR